MRSPGCRRGIEGGLASCQAEFEELRAREIGESSAYAIHRLMVDAYALQHPERYCATARSFAVHLTGLFAAMQRERTAEAFASR